MGEPARNAPNQRAFSRVRAVIPVTIHTSDGNHYAGEVHDISLGGAMIRCSHPFGGAVGEKIKIELRFAGLKSEYGSLIEVDDIDDRGLVRAEEIAEIRWHSKQDFGVKFVRLSRKTQKFLKQMVKFFDKLKTNDIT